MSNAKPRQPSRIPESQPGTAVRRWNRFAKAYNDAAKSIGAPRIHMLADAVRRPPEGTVFLSDDEVRALQLQFYEQEIDLMNPLAEFGFYALKGLRDRARAPRSSAVLQPLFLFLATSPRFKERTDREIWDTLEELSGKFDLTLFVDSDEDRLDWDHVSTQTSGDMKFASFITKLSDTRKAAGTQKRPRRQSS